MFDLELRLSHVDAPFVQRLRDFALLGVEGLRPRVSKRPDRDDRQARINLDAGDGVARRSADERLLKIGMRDRLMRADEAGAKLHARRTHFQIGGDCLAPRDSARDEDRRSEEHTSELQSLMRISYAVSCLKQKTPKQSTNTKPVKR